MKPNSLHSFFLKNADYLNRLIGASEKNNNGMVLVERLTHPIILHSNAIVAKAVARSKKLTIGWLKAREEGFDEQFLSYDAESKIVYEKKLSKKEIVTVHLIFFYWLFRYFLFGKIVNIEYKKVDFGKLIYDAYLSYFNVGTLPKIRFEHLNFAKQVLYNFFVFEKILIKNNVKAVVVSHTVGLESGLLFRAALVNNIPAYHRVDGHGYIGITLYRNINEIYDYPLKPLPSDFEYLMSIDHSLITEDFKKLVEYRTTSGIDRDARLAYAGQKKIFTSKNSFAKEYHLDGAKKNIFIMLHAFNDSPHSHFRKMLFKDYFYWFKETLAFVNNNNKVNWIFKEHPSSKHYPTTDINIKDMFNNCPNHILFLSHDASFNSASLITIADAVITVLGSAGVEFPAMTGIPSIIAGDTFYDGFGFTIEPKTKKEYFDVLSKIDTIQKLSPEQQYKAKAVFLYIAKYHRYPFDWGPFIPYEFDKDPMLSDYYWNLVEEMYQKNPEVLKNQFNYFVEEFSKKDFKRISNFDFHSSLRIS